MYPFKFILLLYLLIQFSIDNSNCNTNTNNYDYINLPKAHLSPYFNKFPIIAEKCRNDNNCEYKDFLLSDKYNRNACWGYESNCNSSYRLYNPECAGDHTGWVKSKQIQLDTFNIQADFGYIKEQINELMIMCEPKFEPDSFLECSKYLRFCRGRNILMNFTQIYSKQPTRYSTNVLENGKFGGYCKLYNDRIKKENEHFGALQSWIPELRYFEELNYRPKETNNLCDIVIDKPTYIMKIDATSNMYHHFCDFINLYMSQHVNQSGYMAFGTDVHVLIWETYTYQSSFSDAFKAFTNYPIWDLKTFQGKVVCFNNIVLPLLPRMIFGLYYNTPIIYGCEKSGLFRAFSEHILHRLKIPELKRTSKNIRITFLARRTKYRRVLNEDELLDEINENENYSIRRVYFESGIPFKEQLEIIRNTDVLISMHGAGLTHLLFLPTWASVFELYNCEDPNCYKDLARLKGINYITWEDNTKMKAEDDGHHPKEGAHAKFTNYWFDKNEFSCLVKNAVNHVVNHEDFKIFIKMQLNSSTHEEL